MQPGGPAAAHVALTGLESAGGGIAFTQAGPYGVPGKLNALAIDPTNSNVLYVASGRGTALESYSSAGIYKTTDRGHTWTAIDRGLTDPDGAISSVVNALWLDSAHASTLLAATEYDGLFRSTDGGTSWHGVYRTTQATQIVSFLNTLYATSSTGILASTDDGATWKVQLAASSSRQPTAFGAVTGSAGNALYAGMTDGTIFAQSNGAWVQRGKLPYDSHTGTDGSNPSVHQIAVDPTAPSTVYASSNDGKWDQDLHASTDGGKTWNTVLPQKIYNDGLGSQAIGFSLVHPHKLYVGSDGGFFSIKGDGSANPSIGQAANDYGVDTRDLWVTANGSDDACYIASDQGLIYTSACSTGTYKQIQYLGGGFLSSLARRFVVTPDQKTIFTSLQDYGSFYTKNGLPGWTYSRAGLYEDGYNELRPGNPNVCFVIDEATGFRVSQDGCVSYAKANGIAAKLRSSRLMTTPIAFDPKNPLHMYVASGDVGGVGFQPAPHAVFGSSDGGTTLAQLPWPVSNPGAIVVDPTNGSHILVGDLGKGGQSSLMVTFDGGKSWSTSTGVPATPFWYTMTVSPANGKTVLASSIDASNNVYVLRSTNGGKTFARIATVVNAPLLRGRVDIDRMHGDASAEEAPHSPPQAFIYSPEREIRYNQDAKAKPAVAITTLRGAFISYNDGNTWTRLDRATIAHSFWGIRWVNGYLYLASDGQGILKSTAVVQK